jgi:Cu/Ag efflux protein CusF
MTAAHGRHGWWRTAGCAVTGLATAAFLLAGCKREAPEPAGSSPAEAIYTVRGVVQQLPVPPANQLMLYHEAVPEFVDRKGERTGMDSMVMPFVVGPGAAMEGIAEGDKVDVTFELRWGGPQTLLITQIVELPPDTQLELGRGPGQTSTDAPAPVVSPSPSPSPAPPDGAASAGSSEAI